MGKTVNDLAPREDWKVFVFCTYFLLIMGDDAIIFLALLFLDIVYFVVFTLREFTYDKQFHKAQLSPIYC